MIKINEHYLKLKASYLFSDIAKRVNAHQQAHPDQEIIRPARVGPADMPR